MGTLGNVLFLIIGVGVGGYIVVQEVRKKQSPTGAVSGAVKWDPALVTPNLQIQGPTLIKLGPFDGWQFCGDVSVQKISGNGSVEMTAPAIGTLSESQKQKIPLTPGVTGPIPPTFTDFIMNPFTLPLAGLVFGITTNDSINNYKDISYGIKLGSDGSLQIVENGASVFDPSFKPGDDLKIVVSNGTVSYLQNGHAIYTSNTPLNGSWKAAASIFNVGQEVPQIIIQGSQ